MNFEKVEIYGFKSFADKAEIKFGNGITGIVGPNGCGKSNVADAIRWVLGEQSAKSLRGTSMQDVIFSGTQNRKSLSYCEVSLFFDNSNKIFSLDYNEIIITRKLYRSGESEYFINKQQSRLKDIIDLLRECGIGKEGYTIIGQGKVEEIMSAKPEDRRAIFEEATGISKFKSRKNESERKLERTHENVLRYSDIISEIENQLAPLERQAEKTREFNELSEQLKLNELNTYVAKVEGVADAKAKINKRIEAVDEQINLRQGELDKAQSDYEHIVNEISQADINLRALNDEFLEKRLGMEQSSGASKLYANKIEYLTGQIETAKAQIEENLTLIADCNEYIKNNNVELEKDNKELQQLSARIDKLRAELLSVSEKIALGEEIASLNQKKVIESIESLTDVKVNKGTMNIERSNLLEKLNELNERINACNQKRDKQFEDKEKIDRSIDDLDRAIYEHKNKIADKESEVRECNESVAKVDNRIYSLNSTISQLVTRDNFYRSVKENYEGYSQSVKLLLTAAKSNPNINAKIKGVVAKLIKSDKKYDIALETALAGAAQNVVTATPDDARYLIEYLKTNRMGRVTFLPITSVKPRMQSASVTSALNEPGALGVANKIVSYDSQYENIISNLLGNTLIVDTLEHATQIAKKYRFEFKMVTLDGDVFSTQGAMTGGARQHETVGLLSGDRRIEDNAKELQIKRGEMDKVKEEKVALEKNRDRALDELSMLNEMYNGKRQQVLIEREKQAVAETSLIEIGRELESLAELVDSVNARLEKIDVDYKSVITGSEKLEADKLSASEKADKQQMEYDALKKQRDALLQDSTDAQIKITEIKANISTLISDNERLNGTIREAKETNEKLAKNNEGAEGIIEGLRRDQEKVALTQAEQDYINGIRDRIEQTEGYKVELNEKLTKNDEQKQWLTGELNNLTEKKHTEDIALSKIDSDLEYMGQSIWEDYQETYDTAIKVKIEGFDATHGEAEINRIRRRRNALGTINGSAIDDFKALKERYDEMITQRDDLIKAEDDLKQAIDTIKGEMLAQFDDGFKKINENFQKIFKELFGGGRAMLELDYTNADDKLEAGVEIIAEPPGKKLQKISLLSGGEKALTAIAILFSILRLRPMPFCVLDEIEAALDEANVDRFARYLKKFSEETQFIVITHRKPTMELADALFGVTMAEKGVSKLVSVKLSDIVPQEN